MPSYYNAVKNIIGFAYLKKKLYLNIFKK